MIKWLAYLWKEEVALHLYLSDHSLWLEQLTITFKQQGLQGQLGVHMEATDLSYLPVQENFTKAANQGRKWPLFMPLLADSIRLFLDKLFWFNFETAGSTRSNRGAYGKYRPQISPSARKFYEGQSSRPQDGLEWPSKCQTFIFEIYRQ